MDGLIDMFKEAVDLLQEAEWSAREGRDQDDACPWCEEWRCTGATHRPTCRFALLMIKCGKDVKISSW